MKQQNIQKRKQGNREIYFLSEDTIPLLEKVQRKQYKVLEEFKNDKRTYVVKIQMDEKLYILKKIFYPRKIKKYLSVFKKGDAVDSFLNIEFARKCFITELASILIVQVERKKHKIAEEICLMEYCFGNHLETEQEFLKSMEILKKIHAIGRFHGDCNPNNFLIREGLEIKVVDTKVKKMLFGNYRAHYDIFTLLQYFDYKGEHPYSKNFYYYIAYMIRKFRNFRNSHREKKRRKI